MKKALKIAGIVVGAIIVLIIAAILILPLVVDPNVFRGDIEAAVARNTDRTLEIKGDMELSVFPWLGVEVSDVTLSNAPGFGEKPFATIDGMQVRVRLLSLLGDHYEVGTLKLDGLKLNLARDRRGKTNWRDLLTSASQSKGEGTGTSGGELDKLTIDAIVVKNATINWDDAKTHSRYRISDAGITIGKLETGKPVPLRMHFSLSRFKPVLHADVDFKTTATLFPNAQRYQLANGTVTMTARGAGLPAQPTHVQAGWRNLQFNRERGTFALRNLTLKTLGIGARATLDGRGVKTHPRVTGTLAVNDFSPRQVLDKIGRHLQPEDPSVLRHASLRSDIRASTDKLQLTDLKATLDDTHISGRLAVSDFATHAIRFTLAADAIDADRYLPAGREQQSKNVPLSALDQIRLPGNRLRGLQFQGSFTIGKLQLLDMTATDIRFGVDAKDGQLTVKPLFAKLYGGTYNGMIDAAATDAGGMKLTTNQKLTAIQFAPLLADLLDKKLLSGNASLAIQFAGQGDTVGALKKTLDGQVDFKLKDGALEGIDLWGAIRRAYATLKGKQPPKNTGADRTKFVTLGGSGAIHDGVLKNNDFRAELPFMRLAGKGQIDLVSRHVDYDLKARIIDIPQIEGRAKLDKLKGNAVPLHIEGDFKSLNAYPTLRNVLKERVNAKKAEVKSQLEKKQKKARGKLEKKKKDAQRQLDKKKTDAKSKLDGKEDDVKARLEDKLKQGVRGIFSG